MKNTLTKYRLTGLLTLLLVLTSMFIHAQTADSSAVKTGFWKSWKPAGISLLIGGSLSNDNAGLEAIFEHTAASQQAKTKFYGDKKNVTGFSNGAIMTKNSEKDELVLRLTFKPRNPVGNRLIHYAEFSAGLRYGYCDNFIQMRGDSALDEPREAIYNTLYYHSSKYLGPDFLLTLQTPALFGYFSFYTGPGIYVAKAFSLQNYTSASIYTTGERFLLGTLIPDSQTTYYDGNNQFYKPVYLLGLYLPVGLKLNVSPRINLFFEYTLNHHISFYKNNYSRGISYKGVFFGLRYKFTQEKAESKKGNSPAHPPAPFY